MDISLACRAAVLAAKALGLESIAFPGMGTGCGAVGPTIAARAMIAGITAAVFPHLFPSSWREAQDRHFQEFS
jgi:O-acetyl-ADP-ribose deacetylase (regulator of RNase III)